jgi:hypothetical protein
LDNILSTLTKEQALGCIEPFDNPITDAIGPCGCFHIGPTFYFKPSTLGLPDDRIVGTMLWGQYISAYYDERDKPRWKEPEPSGWAEPPVSDAIGFHTKGFCPSCREQFYSKGVEDHHAEIARTNARRFLEAWRDLNGGAGRWFIADKGNGLRPYEYGLCAYVIGEITFATEAAAQYIIDNHSAQLRLLN